MNLLRRGLLAALFATLAVPALAQSYPSKAIRVIVPFPAGGGTDIIARVVTNKLSTSLGWSFVIENRPGSGGNLGVDAAAKAAADGYTLALGQTSNLAINPTLYRKMPYDSVKDLAPVGLVASAPLVMVVAADSPYKTLADVVNASKAKPASINFASPGNGTVAHLASELFQKTAGIKFTHVPYKGAAQAATDLIGGQVQLYMSSVPTLIGHIKNGKMRAIAVTSLNRLDDLAQVPTVAESGYKGFEAVTWFGFVAPAAVPKDVVQLLNTEINTALKAADVQKKLDDQGADVKGGTPAQFAALIKSDITRWAPIIKESGATLD
ncbi:tripartite tricarboxylate transporter substrate binding protein [Polaromonas sp. SM01]|uniref:Bug family tripartite tricarboxylate transporter substrate binding protein n=1 Tax=Polaromonas sp. SM01 TaxID=3085630 RepID=UPI0029815770|nr:tripartite tricarboxylate transporter substrate binding protein [Polaromonas sp. SM01]MDW5444413.1 tripartite tricarboxylate transporter substrate binding protein [Polaromonas sp. SM01]